MSNPLITLTQTAALAANSTMHEGGEHQACAVTPLMRLRDFASTARVEGAIVTLDLTKMPYIGSSRYGFETTKLLGKAVDAYCDDMTASKADQAAEIERLRHALEWARNILGNMAMEHTTGWRGIFARWPIHHEPLRSDARAVLPVIDAALEDQS